MDLQRTFSSLQDISVFCVGIKGTGMAALAELLLKRGAAVTGSDTAERFYTDRILKELGIPCAEGFRGENLPKDTDVVVHSAAYDRNVNPELKEAVRRNIPLLVYPEALGLISSLSVSTGIAGTHGKTTTAAICGTILKGSGLPASVLVGAAVSNLGGRSTFIGGNTYFIAETCEYKRHFLHFHPDTLVFTNIEADHLDYFTGYDDCLDAFTEYAGRLSAGGTLIYCADDDGAAAAAARAAGQRENIRLVPYGRTAKGPFSVPFIRQKAGAVEFSLGGWANPFTLRVPGEHTAVNAAAAAAVMAQIAGKEGLSPSETEDIIRRGIEGFTGSSRRSEIIGEAGGIVFMDDYGHHPTEIRATLAGMKRFYPGRRLVVDFMSHTYSRTAAMFHEFTAAFTDADEVVFHKIYGSAREREGPEGPPTNGEKLYRAAREHVKNAVYFQEVMDAKEYLLGVLRRGDIFLTLGAGDNWRLGKELYSIVKGKDETEGI
jgi:UDP-N-acetylmuramate--alanine ligase